MNAVRCVAFVACMGARMAQAEYEGAERMLEKALAISEEREEGEDDLEDVATALKDLGRALESQVQSYFILFFEGVHTCRKGKRVEGEVLPAEYFTQTFPTLIFR